MTTTHSTGVDQVSRAASYVPSWASLGELHEDHRIWIFCSCRRGRLLLPAEVIAVTGPNRPVAILRRDLRCTGCGQKGQAVVGATTIGKLQYLAHQLGYPDPYDRRRPF